MARRAGWQKPPQSPAHPSPPQHVDEDDDLHVGRRGSVSYYRLPEQLLRLSVLKLDGSSFDVEVARTASVVELKTAIEDIFNKPADDEGCGIAWSRAWGHFCLCYKEHKLTDDGTFLQTFGIKDGDQLHFIRHISLNQNLNPRRSRNPGTDFEQNRMSLTRQHIAQEVEENDKHTYNNMEPCRYADEQSFDHGQKDPIVVRTQPKICHFFRGWNFSLNPHKTRSGNHTTKISNRKKFFG